MKKAMIKKVAFIVIAALFILLSVAAASAHHYNSPYQTNYQNYNRYNTYTAPYSPFYYQSAYNYNPSRYYEPRYQDHQGSYYIAEPIGEAYYVGYGNRNSYENKWYAPFSQGTSNDEYSYDRFIFTIGPNQEPVRASYPQNRFLSERYRFY